MNNDTLAIARTILAQNERLLALMEADAPAKTVRKPAQKKTPAKKAPAKRKPVTQPKAATKGSRGYRTGEGMTRKAWNETLSAKARLAGKRDGVTVYRLVMDDWAEVQTLRASGCTPDEVLALYV